MKILLKEIRIKRGWTLRQVEEMTGVSKSALSRLEKGTVSPSADELEMLAKGLNIGIVDLISSEYIFCPDIGTKHHKAPPKTFEEYNQRRRRRYE
ncbi:MAG: helix-turn-helix domain-containing protein [[Clostridium] symbiosum]